MRRNSLSLSQSGRDSNETDFQFLETPVTPGTILLSPDEHDGLGEVDAVSLLRVASMIRVSSFACLYVCTVASVNTRNNSKQALPFKRYSVSQ